ncbi:cation transporter [Parvularcula flava]|uniref:Cation efflux system protein n=1 Tax=Aquisalinus luteolus TaxID=1566827 RepID=A0A8J3A3M9_9PROT|nr:cation diffusion facilitator family transporter [Aquisalinus luteolus]NHK26288.1 cation transporter [Aquisalinus luteolus]GGH91875.1 cation efflux system protein [Aquisalinus luteolus]
MTHSHDHIEAGAGDRRVFGAILVNLLLTVAQIIGGIVSGSLALVADAIHNLSDALALVIAFGARRIARKPADARMTFGYGRAETVAALINYTTLIVIGLYLVYEAILRFIEPQGIDGWIVVIIAAIALVVDLLTVLLTYTLSKESINIRAAFLHNLADALGSVGVIIAGTVIIIYDWRLIDPLITLAIAGYILWQSFSEIGQVIRILMLGSPTDIDGPAVIEEMTAVKGVADVHHVHLWQMNERQTAIDAHVLVLSDSEPAQIKTALKSVLASKFGVSHVTLEIEWRGEHEGDLSVFGSEN